MNHLKEGMTWGKSINVRWRHVLVVAAALPLLTACGEDAKRSLGWEKTPPDEFSVLTRAPLVQPPDYDLRPPSPTGVRSEEATTDRAKKVLMPSPSLAGATPTANDKGASTLAGLSPGEAVLLKKAGAENASPAIRQQVDQETTSLVQESKSFADDLLFWQTKAPPGDVVDPAKEQQRLEVNASLGQSVTEGETPQIVRRQKGWLEGIF